MPDATPKREALRLRMLETTCFWERAECVSGDGMVGGDVGLFRGGGVGTWVLCCTLSCTMGCMASSRSSIMVMEVEGC